MSQKYDDYLKEHIGNVQKAYHWIESNLPELVQDLDGKNIMEHDASKIEPDEYYAYDSYFYGGNKSYQVVQDFNKAWLLHSHRNPHHWQYWVLINDEPNEGLVCIEIPYKYIVEMICDWWAFSWKSGKLYEIFDWYDEHSPYIKLEDNTRKTVESILDQIREVLSKEESDGK